MREEAIVRSWGAVPYSVALYDTDGQLISGSAGQGGLQQSRHSPNREPSVTSVFRRRNVVSTRTPTRLEVNWGLGPVNAL
jgi:hypothetical protein